MFLLRVSLFRIPITLDLLCLLGVSILFIKNSIESAWQSDRQEEALYLKSPNCFPPQDATEVDLSLPPCQSLMATVIAKPQNTVIDHISSPCLSLPPEAAKWECANDTLIGYNKFDRL